MKRFFSSQIFLTLPLVTLTVSGLSACSQSSTAQNPQEGFAQGPIMVAAADERAVDAGLEILRKGGTAIDAAIAVQTVIGLVEPQSSGIGGGAFMVYYEASTNKTVVYDGRETAPMAVTEDLFKDEDGKPLRYFDGIASGRSTGVPGAIPALHMAHKEHGKLPWAEGFETAIKLGDEGFAVSPRMANSVKRMGQFVLGRQDAARKYFFLDDGETTIPEGFVRDNKAYADSLRALQINPRALHEGPIAQAIIDAVNEEPYPGTLTLEDLARYQPTKRDALCSPYRGKTICSAPPPSSGGVAIQSILGLLEGYDMSAYGPDSDTHITGWNLFIQASQLAYADRDKYVADPEFVEVPTQDMLAPDYLKARRDLIQTDKAMSDIKAGNPVGFPQGEDATPDSPGTSHFSILDGYGNVVSMTTTVEAPFGSQRMAAGFILNNQLTDFSFRSEDAQGVKIANRVEPGKRPRSSMSPAIVFDEDGKFYIAVGSPGGNSIIAYTAKALVAMLDWDMDPQAAADLVNVIARGKRVRIEEALMAPDLLTRLEEMGHEVSRSNGEASGLHIIKVNPDGTLSGGADPRREGVAKGEILSPVKVGN